MNIMNCKIWIIDDAKRAQSRIDDSERDKSRPYVLKRYQHRNVMNHTSLIRYVIHHVRLNKTTTNEYNELQNMDHH